MSQEKRQNKRLTLSLPIDYKTLGTNNADLDSTICKNISEGGLKLVLKNFFPPKTKFLLKIKLADINKVVEAIAESAWSFNMHFSNMYYNGLRFIDLNASNRKQLQQYIMMKEIVR